MLEGFHVFLTEELGQGFVAGGIVFLVGDELVVELVEQVVFLQIVAEIAGLGIVGAAALAIEFPGIERHQIGKAGQATGIDDILKPGQAPVGQALDPFAVLAALLVERSQPLVEPRRTLGEIGVHERMDNLMHQRPAASPDVHDQGLVLR